MVVVVGVNGTGKCGVSSSSSTKKLTIKNPYVPKNQENYLRGKNREKLGLLAE